MKRVAVIGGGPAGAVAAHKLAAAGVDTVVLDEKLAWEKPCGGGLSARAYHEYPFLIENDTPKRQISKAVLTVPGSVSAPLDLPHAMLIYSRRDLNHMLLERAAAAGAAVEKTRVVEMARNNGKGWRLRTRDGVIEADFCIVANGARNSFHEFGTRLGADDVMLTQAYLIPGEQDHVEIAFPTGFEGYLWVFPRCGHLSVGICGKGESSAELRRRLHVFMRERELLWEDGDFYSHVLPALSAGAWRTNRFGGDGWLAVGDAAGLVDPVTGEGLYYAVRSADLAAQALLDDPGANGAASASYSSALKSNCADDLAFGSVLAPRFFLSQVLFNSMPSQSIRFTRYSSIVRTIFQDVFTGYQPYRKIRSRLTSGWNADLREVLIRLLLARVIPSE